MDANKPIPADERVNIVRQIIWLSKMHFQLNSAKLDETGIGSGQIPVLLELNHHGELNQRELAEHTRVTPATMSGMLKRMEKNGVIIREADENDARISRVRLTEGGKAQCEHARQLFEETCYQMLDGLDEDSLSLLRNLLTRIQENIGGMKGCPMQSTKKE